MCYVTVVVLQLSLEFEVENFKMPDSTELIKLIVEELGKEPFKLEFNVSSFGSLNHTGLLKIFHLVLCEVDPNYKQESQSDHNGSMQISSVLELLRVLRYWPQKIPPEDIKEALETPIPETIWSIIAWLLMKMDQLKERAYLAQFLVKIPIPEEMLLEEEVSSCFDQYEDQIELFKETHKRLQDIKYKMEKRPVNELVSDLGRIGHDIECISRKVESVKNKIGEFPEKEEYLQKAQLIRKARDTKAQTKRQIDEEENKVDTLNQRQQILELEIQDMMDLNDDGNPETAINRLEQDAEVLKEIVEDKLPRQIDQAKMTYLALRITEETPPLCKADLEFRKQRIEEVLQEIQTVEFLLLPKMAKLSYPEDATTLLNFAREQTHLNVERKQVLEEKMVEVKKEFDRFSRELDDKKEKAGVSGDKWTLNPKRHKEYVDHMRIKAGEYKEMRRELQGLQAEMGHLSVTKFILDGELKNSQCDLIKIEEHLGIVGLSEAQTQLESVSHEKALQDQSKVQGINNMADLAKELHTQLGDNKEQLQHVILQVKNMREEVFTLNNAQRMAKERMEKEIGPINKDIENLQEVMKESQQKYEKDQLLLVKIKAEIPVMKTELVRATGFSGQGPYARNNLDCVRGKVVENERTKQEFMTEIDQLDDVQEYELDQKQMWSDLKNILQVKVGLLQQKRQITSAEMGTSRAYDSWENPSASR